MGVDMSTRATVHFIGGKDKTEKPTAIAYRHGDGNPEALGKDLFSFFKKVKAQCGDFIGGTRFNDASYLAAKWIVYDAVEMAEMNYGIENRHDNNKKACAGDIRLLRFSSVGIVDSDPGDIDYRYLVMCDGSYANKKFPKVICQQVGEVEEDGTEYLKVEKEWVVGNG